MRFKYRARDENGEPVDGQIEARDRGLALDVLRDGGLIVLNLKPLDKEPAPQEHGTAGAAGGGTGSPKKAMVFFRQLATMIKSGLDLAMSFDVIAEQEKNPSFKKILLDIKSRLDRGVPLSQAMRQHSFFSGMMISLVKAGEEGGILGGALERAADLLEKQAALRSRVRSALCYPCAVVSLALFVLAVFVTVVLPKFRDMFDSMHIELPWLTRAALNFGSYCASNWMIILPVAAAVVLIPFFLLRSRMFKPLMDRIKLKLPALGGITLKASMAQATRTLSAMTAAGVPILRSLEMAGVTADNVVVRRGFDDLRDAAKRGVALGDAAKQVGIFPVLVSQMLRIGTETGRLDNMMERVASWYDQELEAQIKTMLSLMEPILIIIVGGIVALIALCLLGPFTSAMSQMAL